MWASRMQRYQVTLASHTDDILQMIECNCRIAIESIAATSPASTPNSERKARGDYLFCRAQTWRM